MSIWAWLYPHTKIWSPMKREEFRLSSMQTSYNRRVSENNLQLENLEWTPPQTEVALPPTWLFSNHMFSYFQVSRLYLQISMQNIFASYHQLLFFSLEILRADNISTVYTLYVLEIQRNFPALLELNRNFSTGHWKKLYSVRPSAEQKQWQTEVSLAKVHQNN